MKRTLAVLGGLSLVALLAPPCLAGADAAAGYVDFGKFTAPGSGGQFVEVNLKNNLLAMVARLAEAEEPAVAQVLRGLQAVRVNVIGLDDKNKAELEGRMQRIRQELEQRGWERIVAAVQTNEDVGVYLKMRGQEAVEGLVVTVLEAGKEAVFINVVGDIKPEQIAAVGERLNIEPLKKAAAAMKKS